MFNIICTSAVLFIMLNLSIKTIMKKIIKNLFNKNFIGYFDRPIHAAVMQHITRRSTDALRLQHDISHCIRRVTKNPISWYGKWLRQHDLMSSLDTLMSLPHQEVRQFLNDTANVSKEEKKQYFDSLSDVAKAILPDYLRARTFIYDVTGLTPSQSFYSLSEIAQAVVIYYFYSERQYYDFLTGDRLIVQYSNNDPEEVFQGITIRVKLQSECNITFEVIYDDLSNLIAEIITGKTICVTKYIEQIDLKPSQILTQLSIVIRQCEKPTNMICSTIGTIEWSENTMLQNRLDVIQLYMEHEPQGNDAVLIFDYTLEKNAKNYQIFAQENDNHIQIQQAVETIFGSVEQMQKKQDELYDNIITDINLRARVVPILQDCEKLHKKSRPELMVLANKIEELLLTHPFEHFLNNQYIDDQSLRTILNKKLQKVHLFMLKD